MQPASKKLNSRKSGSILAMVMIVVTVFMAITAGLYNLYSRGAVETKYAELDKQAFWHAESGLQDAHQRLRFDEAFRITAQGGVATISKTDYTVEVRDNGTGDLAANVYSYDVVSVGHQGAMERALKQKVDLLPTPGGPIMTKGHLIMDANTIVGYGPIFLLDGATAYLDDRIPSSGSYEDRVQDLDYMILGAGSAITGGNARENEDYYIGDLPIPADLPPMPAADSMLEIAQALIVGNVVPPAADLNLGGGTLYYNIPAGITINSITGPGTLVNTGPITFTAKPVVNDVDIVNDVSIISGMDIIVLRKNDFAGNALLFARNIDIDGMCNFLGNSLLVAYDPTGYGIILGSQSKLIGLAYSMSAFEMLAGTGGNSDTRVDGAVISHGDCTINSNSKVVYNPDTTGDYPPDGRVVRLGKWEELR